MKATPVKTHILSIDGVSLRFPALFTSDTNVDPTSGLLSKAITMADQITQLFSELSFENNPVPVLEAIRSAVIGCRPPELRELVPKLDGEKLVACLGSGDVNQVELTCAILDRIIDCIEPTEILSHYGPMLFDGLSSPLPVVRKLALKEWLKIAEKSSLHEKITEPKALQSKLIPLLGDDDLAIAVEASKVLANFGANIKGKCTLWDPEAMKELSCISAKSDIVRYRVYELVVKVCAVSAEHMTQCMQSNLLQLLFEDSKSHDVLIQMNAVELLATMAAYPHGLEYLDRQGVLKLFERNLESQDPLFSIALPGYMKFFGVVFRNRPSSLSLFPIFFKKLFTLLGDSDMALIGVAAETLGFIGTTIEGKIALNNLGETMISGLRELGRLMNHPNSDLRLKIVESVAQLLKLPEGSVMNNELVTLTESWFRALDDRPMDLVMGLVRQPFPDIRATSLLIFQSIASQAWGQSLMSNYPAFAEFLLDRKAEPNKTCGENKFAIVEALVASPTASQYFNDYTMAQLRDHEREGLYFAHAQSTVAMEMGD